MPQTLETPDYSIFSGLENLSPLADFLAQKSYSSLAVICDDNTEKDCYPLVKPHLPPHIKIRIPAGETHKTLDYAQKIWKILTKKEFDRKSAVVNIGGGMIGDLGGFVAACYKRGIDFIQVPTSLLAMVDASVGGKTGVNYEGFKNQIGAFHNPAAVFLYPEFLKTLPEAEVRSGYAEMLKHGLISDAAHWSEVCEVESLSPTPLGPHLLRSVEIKEQIVRQDPQESGLRKALNFGHTIGHAIESFSLSEISQKKLRHGEAVALGMAAEAWIAFKRRALLTEEEFERITAKIFSTYEVPKAGIPAWEEITSLVRQDKKNADDKILCTLIGPIGEFHINQEISRQEVFLALKFLFRDSQKDA